MYKMKYGYLTGLTIIFISGCIAFPLENLENELRSQKTIKEDEKAKELHSKSYPVHVLSAVQKSLSRSEESPADDENSFLSLNPWIRKESEGLKKRLKRAEEERGTGLPTSETTESPPGGSAAGQAGDKTTENSAVEKSSIWEQHKWFFIIVLIFFIVSMILLAICLCCTLGKCCRGAQQSVEPTKPLHDQELEPEQLTPKMKHPYDTQQEPLLAARDAAPAMAQAPLQGQAPPQSPQDDENGWIIPMDQLTQEELQQTEVPLTKF